MREGTGTLSLPGNGAVDGQPLESSNSNGKHQSLPTEGHKRICSMAILTATLSSLPLTLEIKTTFLADSGGCHHFLLSSCLLCMGHTSELGPAHSTGNKPVPRARRLHSLLSSLAPPAGLPEGGQNVHTRPCAILPLSNTKLFLSDKDPGPMPAPPQGILQ